MTTACLVKQQNHWCAMAEFRVYCRSEEGRIVWGEDFEAPDLTSAIAKATSICRAQQGTARGGMEIWQGTSMVFPRP